jgi:hypothetical protein
MERFQALQPLIEAVVADFAGFRERLAAVREATPGDRAAVDGILAALRTPVYAQELDVEGRRLLGERRVALENDRPWEAHLIEGIWVHEHRGRYFLFYAGNDFSTPEYGTGVAVADSPFGPYAKRDEPLLRSTRDWAGPGHPSVAMGPDGRPRLFLHAFFPGEAGYKRFRAVLAATLRFDGDEVTLE